LASFCHFGFVLRLRLDAFPAPSTHASSFPRPLRPELCLPIALRKLFCGCFTHPAKPSVSSLALKPSFTHTFPFARPACRATSFFLLPAPEGADGAPRRRIQRSRLRGASDHAYEACIAPAPNQCARLSALRLAVSVTGDRTFHCPALLRRTTSSGRSAPGRNSGGRTPAPPPAATFHRGSGGRHPRSAFRIRL